MKAMHAICHLRDGNPDYFETLSDELVRSGIWKLSEGEAAGLQGGWLYLHESSKDPAWFIGVIDELDGPDAEGKYWLTARRKDLRRAVHWRGPTPSPIHHINVVDATNPYETKTASA